MSTEPAPPTTEFPRSIGQPATRALVAAGLRSYQSLTTVTAAYVAQLHGVGPKAMRVLHEEVALRGLAFAQETIPAPPEATS